MDCIKSKHPAIKLSTAPWCVDPIEIAAVGITMHATLAYLILAALFSLTPVDLCPGALPIGADLAEVVLAPLLLKLRSLAMGQLESCKISICSFGI